jgi:hypothetical protein
VKHRRTTIIAAVTAAALLVASAAFASSSAKTFVFTGKYKGTATTKVTDNVVDIAATGAGTGSFIGAGKITGVGKGDSSDPQNCVPFNGPGKMTGASGTISFKALPTSKACGDEAGKAFAVTGKAQVLSATGKLAKTKGTLKFTGHYNRDTGDFDVTFKGTLTR